MIPSGERIPAGSSEVGGLPIKRALPSARRRLIGAWCFLDHAGPADLAPAAGMRVGPHPHTCLQTFSWMIEGEILHRDSLGSEQVLRPGQVNLMTAGRGIAHSEESLSERLQLAQLWIALPEAQRFCAPAFEHFPRLPRLDAGGFVLTVLAGAQDGERSPIPLHTPLLGLDLACAGPAQTRLSLDPGFEHGLLVLEGAIELSVAGPGAGEAERLEPGSLFYLPPGFDALLLRAPAAARLLLLGGAPLAEKPLLWWNFVGRDSAEIAAYARDWNAASGRFEGMAVRGYRGERLLAPDASALRLRGGGS
jgi:quercetin 2,3-dioxygenase